MNNSSISTLIVVSFLLFLSFSSQLSAKKPKCHPQDQKALDQVLAAFGGFDTIGDCCNWGADIITCDKVAPYRVIRLYLRQIYGDNSNNITVNIPPAIGNLSQLLSLTISISGLSGPFPTSILRLNNLVDLDLSFNSLSGPIPPELSQLPKLKVIYLDGNKLTGTIPESFGQLRFSRVYGIISLSDNLLTGTIPKSLGNMINLTTLDLSGNNFIGDPSFLFGINKSYDFLRLERNNLTFDLSKAEFPLSMVGLDLSHNNIFGSLPQQLTQLPLIWNAFNVSYNRLCGEIPQGGSLQQYGPESYFHNKCLCGAPLSPCTK